MNSEQKPSKEMLNAWSSDPKNWKWGIFYYNKLDKRLMPPKRIPTMGFTINFANMNSIMFFVFLILIPILIIIFISK